jgi:flavorubredoxin
MQQVLEKAVMKNIKNKKAVYFGSYGWSKGGYKKTQEIIGTINWELLEGIEFAGKVTPELHHTGYEFGKRFAETVIYAKTET